MIVTTGNWPTFGAKKATSTIPIVMTTSSDPVAQGLVASLARPGGNVTGLSSLAAELNTKRFCGGGTEAEIGGDRDSARRQRFRECVSNRKAEAGRRDYDDCHSRLFRRKKADCRAGRQIQISRLLLPEGVCG